MRTTQGGFSLIETILFIVIVSIAVMGITMLFAQNVRHSHEPLLRQQAIALASAYMDEILHKRWDENSPVGGGCVESGSGVCSGATLWTAGATYTTGEQVVPTDSNGHVYEARNDGTAGAEPVWPTDGTTINDGGVEWLDKGQLASINTEEANRSEFDDVDDYNGLNESPPQDPEGNELPGQAVFSVTVDVGHPGTVWQGIHRLDVKQIKVTVTSGTGETISLMAYRVNY